MRNIKVKRMNSAIGNLMYQSYDGGWVAYTDYCQMVSRLNKKISRLEETIIRTRQRELGISDK